MEEGYDEELEKLLGEIPRATSTAPHLEELQAAAHNYHHQHISDEVSHGKDGPFDEADTMQTLAPPPLIYTPPLEPLQTSPPLRTHAYGDPLFLSNLLSPFYKGLSHDINDGDMPSERALSQARQSVDSNLTLSHISTDYLAHPGQGALPSVSLEAPLTVPHQIQGYAEQSKVKKSVCLPSSGVHLDASPRLSAVGAAMTSVSGLRCHPTLQLIDSFAHNVSESVEKELQNDIGKLSLNPNCLVLEDRLRVRFVHTKRTPLEMQETRHLSGGQRIPPQEPAMSTLTNAAIMQNGSQHSIENGVFLPSWSSGFISPYPSEMQMVFAQQMHEVTSAQQQQMEERVLCRQRIKEEFLLRQQKLQEQQAQFYASLQNQPGPRYSRRSQGVQCNSHSPHNSTCMFEVLQRQPTSKTALLGVATPERIRTSAGMWASPPSLLLGEPTEALDVCRYNLHGYCTREHICPFPRSCLSSTNGSTSDAVISSETCSTLKGPRNGPIASTVVIPTFKKKNQLANGHAPLSNGTHLSFPSHLTSMSGDFTCGGMDPEVLQTVNTHHLVQQPPLPPKYTTLKEVEGHIYGIAKDQHGCRFLQRKFEEGISEDVQKIFVEIIDHVVELMTDPFGNYLVQKLLEVCDEVQRMEILYKVTGKDQLVTISLNMHGTRAVQKLIETLNSSEQVSLVVTSLKQGVVALIKDLNGNHVVQRCLQRLRTEDSQFIFDAAACHCVEIATHRHGCCVLQRCVDFSSGQQHSRLVAEIAANALVLSQDAFGNYVVQYILDLGLTWAIEEVVARLDGNYVHLAMQKFSSNVVEKCLKLSKEERKAQIIRELTSTARLAQLLQDPFANYVVQSALVVTKGALHVGLVEAIRPHLPALRSSPYGKRILSRTSLKK